MIELPTGTVTFLFTDLESSTRLWEEQPGAMEGALARHDEILRGAIESHGGVVFSEMGDGMAAAFASPAGAVAAAVQAQCLLGDEPWGEVGALRARMGLHAGEGALRADGQYVNAPLNRCARLMAVAHGGQVLASESVAPLVRGLLPSGVEFVALGEHRLRDLADPIGVFQVTHPGLPRGFPPLRSLDTGMSNLPVQLTAFVGPERELDEIANVLAAARVVTVTGIGGVGKTRVALELAARNLSTYRDGAWFCELGPVTDPDAVVEVIATALGVTARPGQSIDDSLLDFLRAKRLLLVLDNCEHLLDSVAAVVDRVVLACAEVAVRARDLRYPRPDDHNVAATPRRREAHEPPGSRRGHGLRRHHPLRPRQPRSHSNHPGWVSDCDRGVTLRPALD